MYLGDFVGNSATYVRTAIPGCPTHMRPRMPMNVAQHKIVNLLKTFFFALQFLLVFVYLMWGTRPLFFFRGGPKMPRGWTLQPHGRQAWPSKTFPQHLCTDSHMRSFINHIGKQRQVTSWETLKNLFPKCDLPLGVQILPLRSRGPPTGPGTWSVAPSCLWWR